MEKIYNVQILYSYFYEQRGLGPRQGREVAEYWETDSWIVNNKKTIEKHQLPLKYQASVLYHYIATI